jgi:hypothetical protein
MLQYKISHLGYIVFVNSRVWRLRKHDNGLPLRALDDFDPFLWIGNKGLEIETVPVGPKVQYWDNFIGLKVPNGDNFCGTWTEDDRWWVITAVAIIGRIDIPEGRGDITANC